MSRSAVTETPRARLSGSAEGSDRVNSQAIVIPLDASARTCKGPMSAYDANNVPRKEKGSASEMLRTRAPRTQ